MKGEWLPGDLLTCSTPGKVGLWDQPFKGTVMELYDPGLVFLVIHVCEDLDTAVLVLAPGMRVGWVITSRMRRVS